METSKSRDNIIEGFKPREIIEVTLEVHQENQRNEVTRVKRPLQNMLPEEKH